MTALIIVAVVVVVLIMWLVGIYNRLVRLRNQFKNAFSQIDVQLKRRYDLIPNLVETVKGYMKFERETLEAVIAARNRAVTAEQAAAANPANADAMRELQTAEAGLTAGLGKVFALAEAYPDLKASQNFLDLQAQLADTENKVGASRKHYNDAVNELNSAVSTIPWMFFAGMAGVKKRDFYEAPEEQRAAPRVQF